MGAEWRFVDHQQFRKPGPQRPLERRRQLFRKMGVPASQGQITTVLCSLMLIFGVAALFRMILIVVPQPA
jgi:hypothetical protein